MSKPLRADEFWTFTATLSCPPTVPENMVGSDGQENEELGAIQTSPVGGGGDETTVKLTFTLCDKLPLVPVTLTLKVIVGVPRVVENVRVARAVPPDTSMTLVGLIIQPGQLGHNGGGEVAKFTVPLKPPMLESIIELVAVEPC